MSASKLLHTKTIGHRDQNPRRIFWTGALAAGIILLAACGKGDTAADANPSEAGSSTSTSYYSPLNEYMSPEGAEEFDQEEWEAKDRQVQELIAPCMKEQGFDYIPQDSSSVSYGPVGDENLSERDMIAKYGYWVTTQQEMQPDPSEMPVDPNQAAYEAMSDSERMAYDQALWGTGAGMAVASSSAAGGEAVASTEVATTEVATTEVATTEAVSTDPAASSTDVSDVSDASGEAPISIAEGEAMSESYAMPTTPEELGCYGVAQQEIFGDQMYGNNITYEDFQDLFDAQNELYMSIEKDPRLAEAVTAWSTCLEGKGYPGFTSMSEPQKDVSRKYGDLTGQTFVDYGDGGWGMEMKEGQTEPVEPDAGKLAELKKYEIDLALADYDCKGDYNKLAEEVRISLEEQFIEDHKADLERYRDAINSGGN